MSTENVSNEEKGNGVLADVSKSACLCDFSDRYWDKNGSKCLKCGKYFS